MNIRPTIWLIKALCLLLLLSVIGIFYPDLSWLVFSCLALFAILFFVDFFFACIPVNLEIVRQHSSTLPIGVPAKIKLHLLNLKNRSIKGEIIDHYPTVHHVEVLPVKIEFSGRQEVELEYRLTPLIRGFFEMNMAEIKIETLFGFWHKFIKIPVKSEFKVYPNYSEVMKYGILAAEQRLSQMGILKKRRRGQGTDFYQLREFRKGDRLNSIDWKSTARLREIISKDYQLEQDQQIFFLLDCGRRMRSMDGDLSHFDHSVNAMLLLNYVASRQGDAVGMMTFAGPKRFLPTVKSRSNVNRFLNALYDVHPTHEAADYLVAAENLKSILNKRSMVVILSNLRGEDDRDLIKALELLRTRHLVIFVALREEIFEIELNKEVRGFNDALKYASLQSYLKGREETLHQLRQANIITIDTNPGKLHIEMVNRYFEIKGSGRL